MVLSQYVEAEYAGRLFEDGSGGRAYLLFAKLGLTDEPDSHHRVRAVPLYIAATSAEHS